MRLLNVRTRTHACPRHRRRLLIGAALTAGAAAFALLPTEALRARPPKPLYFYIVPLLRVKVRACVCGGWRHCLGRVPATRAALVRHTACPAVPHPVQALLADSQEIIDEADWPQLRTLLSRVKVRR